MTNSICVAHQLDRRCLNLLGDKRDHDHLQLESGRPRQAEVYPEELRRAICRGIRDQIDLDRNGLYQFEELKCEDIGKIWL